MKNNNLIERKERIWYWDTVKFLMIFAVVIGHFVEKITLMGKWDVAPLNLFIYAFHMPMFIFIFGVFYKAENYKKKALFFLTAGYIFKIFSYFSSLAINGEASFTLFYDRGITWFLFVLVWYTLLGKALEKFDKRIVLAVSFAISLFTGYFEEIDDFLCISRMLVFFPYFWLGTMINRNDFLEKLRKFRHYLWIPAACILLGWLAISFFYGKAMILSPLFTGRNPFSEETDGIGCLYRLLTSAITVVTGLAILILVPEKKVPVISYLGRNTLNVYFWHYTFLYITFRFLNAEKLIGSGGGILLLLIIGAAVTFLLSLNIFGFPLKYVNRLIMNLKKKDDRV